MKYCRPNCIVNYDQVDCFKVESQADKAGGKEKLQYGGVQEVYGKSPMVAQSC